MDVRSTTTIVTAIVAMAACSADDGGGRVAAWAGYEAPSGNDDPEDSTEEDEHEDENESSTSDGSDADDDVPTLNITAYPDFRMPFPCGADVETVTYFGHNPDDKKMDMRRVGMPTGSPIVAAAAGVVHEKFSPGGIEIRHGNGWFTTYMHLEWSVAVGTWVEQGDVVGEMGNVGSPDYHLHHEQLYAPGQNNAHTSDMVHPVIQGEGPMVLVPNQFFTRRSTNCGDPLVPYGKIGEKWNALGGNGSVVGKAIRPEYPALFGGRFQDFEKGMIIWHPQRAPNAWAVHGKIFEVYRASGSEESWGFPTMDERDAAAGPNGTRGRFQYFEDALFLWSHPAGAFPVVGPIHDAFAAHGREQALGYPLGREEPEGADGLKQEFENATIHWSPDDGATIE